MILWATFFRSYNNKNWFWNGTSNGGVGEISWNVMGEDGHKEGFVNILTSGEGFTSEGL